jgi:hypothetical protein
MKLIEHNKVYDNPHHLILHHVGADVQLNVWDGVCSAVQERVVRLLRVRVRRLFKRSSR